MQSFENRRRVSFRKPGQPPKRTPAPKHPYSCMVWGGISKRGATGLVIFKGIMDSQFYCEEILARKVVPFKNVIYAGTDMKFMQDNDSKHVSRYTQAFMTQNDINWWPTPPESPDINPIEMVWKELKDHCEMAATKEELVAKIKEFWRTLTPAKCTKYIDHIHKVIPVIIEKGGDVTGH